MSESHKLSLVSAILININIMLGSGIFINTVLLSKASGALGALVYLLVGLLMLPLIIVFAELLKFNQGGTFYEFGHIIHPFVGFLSSWSYFTAKLASCALSVHIFVTLVQRLIPVLSTCNPLMFDSGIIILFLCLNLFNMRIGRSIQYAFIVLKLIPITFVLLAALFFFTGAYYTVDTFMWEGIPESIPFVLFAFSGFEASCSLSRSIRDPHKNGPRAIFISYFIVLSILILYQLGLFGILGSQLGGLASFRDVYPVLVTGIFPNSASLQVFFKAITLLGIAASSLGASYGIMYSNAWNLYALAQHGHTFVPTYIGQLNRHHVPFVCVIIEGILALSYTWLAQGNQVPLQQMSALGSTIAYSLSAISFMFVALFITRNHRLVAALSLVSCLVLAASTINNGMVFGAAAYYGYGALIIAGLFMFSVTLTSSKQADTK